jgi:hypothetical protein
MPPFSSFLHLLLLLIVEEYVIACTHTMLQAVAMTADRSTDINSKPPALTEWRPGPASVMSGVYVFYSSASWGHLRERSKVAFKGPP